MNAPPEISVVLPIFNEQEMIGECLSELTGELEQTGLPFEIICVDDGSSDRTAEVLDQHAQTDPRIVPIHFSRNFGKEAALSAGLEATRGRAVVFMDADLQHPPRLIHPMIARWREGYDLVEAVKDDRGQESFFRKITSQAFYALMGRAIGRNLQGASDFKLVDRQVADALLQFPERRRFFRGLVAWVGFRVAHVPFRVEPRPRGQTKWSSRSLVAYSIQNLIAFSSAPLRVVAWVGFVTVVAAMLLAVYQLYSYFSGEAVSGFTTVIIVMLMLCGLILVSLGVIAVYLAGMYDEQKGRPAFVIRRPPARRGTGAEPPTARGQDGGDGAGISSKP